MTIENVHEQNNYWKSTTWTTGLTQNSVKMPFPAFFKCGREANHVYSAYFAEFAPLAC